MWGFIFDLLFIELINSGETFTEFDYMEETPSWAVYGAPEEGFNPEHTWTRKIRKLRPRAQESLNKALEGIENDQDVDVKKNTYVEMKEELNATFTVSSNNIESGTQI